MTDIIIRKTEGGSVFRTDKQFQKKDFNNSDPKKRASEETANPQQREAISNLVARGFVTASGMSSP